MIDKLKTVVSPSARGIVQGLKGLVQDSQIAFNSNDLDAASELFKTGSDLVKELLPKLTDNKIFKVFLNILSANLDLNRKLASRSRYSCFYRVYKRNPGKSIV